MTTNCVFFSKRSFTCMFVASTRKARKRRRGGRNVNQEGNEGWSVDEEEEAGPWSRLQGGLPALMTQWHFCIQTKKPYNFFAVYQNENVTAKKEKRKRKNHPSWQLCVDIIYPMSRVPHSWESISLCSSFGGGCHSFKCFLNRNLEILLLFVEPKKEGGNEIKFGWGFMITLWSN